MAYYKTDQATVSLIMNVYDMVEGLLLYISVGSRPSPRPARRVGAIYGGTRPHDLHEVKVKSLCLPANQDCQYLMQTWRFGPLIISLTFCDSNINH